MQTLIFSDISNIGYGKNAGAYLIASHLRQNNFSCQVVDHFTQYSLDELKKIVDKFVLKDTLWVGFSTTFLSSFDTELGSKDLIDAIDNDVPLKEIIIRRWSCIPSTNIFSLPTEDMIEFFQYIRSKNEKIKIIIGGAKTWNAFQSDGLLRKILADYYIRGNADYSIIVLTKWLFNSSNPTPIFEGPNKNIIESFKNYEYVDFPTCRLKFEHNDFVSKDEYLPIEIARGCIFKCKFCNFPLIGKKAGDYTRSKETIRDEFIYNYENFGTTKYMFMDETPNDSMEKVEFLYDIISNLPFKIEWGGYARLELYYSNPEMKHIMKEIGVSNQFFGIETFNKKAGESVGKGMHKDKILQTLSDLRSTWGKDVHLTSGFIVGLPHETKETIKDLENYMRSDNCMLDAALISPLFLSKGMGSIFGDNPQKYGYTHPYADSPNRWVNEHMTFEDAQIIAYGTMLKIAKTNSLQNWSLMRLHNIGLNRKEIQSMTMYNFSKNLDLYRSMMVNQKNLYLEKLLAL
jgi:radical SAM superfamily enzyme YgiQ (UPF0313 family)